MVLEKRLESPLESCKEIKQVNPKGNQSWTFIGKTDAETEAPIFWPPDTNILTNWLIGKDPDAGNDWKQDEKGTAEDETVGWHHRLDGHEFEQASGIGDGQGDLACCSLWGCKEPDMTERLNWTYDPCSLALVFVLFKLKNISSSFYSLVLAGKDFLFVPWADRITSRILSCTALELVYEAVTSLWWGFWLVGLLQGFLMGVDFVWSFGALDYVQYHV